MENKMKKMIEPFLQNHIGKNYYDEPEYIELMDGGNIRIPRLFLLGLDFSKKDDIEAKIQYSETGIYWILEDEEYIQYLIFVNGKSLESLVFHSNGTVDIHEYDKHGEICGEGSEFYKDFTRELTVKCLGEKLELLKKFLEENEIKYVINY